MHQTVPLSPHAEGAHRRRAAGSRAIIILRRLLRNRKGAFGVAVLSALVFVAILCPYFSPYDPAQVHLTAQLTPPSSTYRFGTDELGRDVFSRVLYGSRPSLGAGVLIVVLAAVVGSLTGLVAGYTGGWSDAVIMRVWDTLLAFPAIFLAIGIVTVLGPGWINSALAIAAVATPVFSRLVRAVTLSTARQDFVVAARALGCSDGRIMRAHVFPACLAPLIVQMAIAAPDAILVEAALSFLGLGSRPPAPSWGNMLSAAQGYLGRSVTYALFPGLAITLVVLGMNFFADGLRDALDPQQVRSA